MTSAPPESGIAPTLATVDAVGDPAPALPRSERLVVALRVIQYVEDDTSIPCTDLATLADDLPGLAEWKSWLMRRRRSALRVQRTPTQRLELLLHLGALVETLENRS